MDSEALIPSELSNMSWKIADTLSHKLQFVQNSPAFWCTFCVLLCPCIWIVAERLLSLYALSVILTTAARRCSSEASLFSMGLYGCCWRVCHVYGQLCADPEYIQFAVRRYGWRMCAYASAGLLGDRDFLLSVISINCKVLRCSSVKHLLEDPEFVLRAVEIDPGVLKFVSRRFRKDRTFLLQAISSNGGALVLAPADMQADPEIVLKAASSSPQALAHASPEVRSDPKVVLQAIEYHWAALKWASRKLRSDPDILLAAVKSHGNRLVGLDEKAPSSRAMREGPLLFASADLCADVNLVLEAVKENGQALRCASAQLRDNPRVVLVAVRQDGLSLQWASRTLRSNPSIVLEATRQNWRAFQYAVGAAAMDMDVWEAAVKQDGRAVHMLPGMDGLHGGLCISE